MSMIVIFLFLFALPALLLTIDFLNFLVSGRRLYHKAFTWVLEVTGMLGLPLLYLWMLDESKNNCCSDSATFSPDHKLTIYVLVAISIIAYFYSSF